jgi:ribosome-binding protein aMBF1 (putative translation factor)
MQPMTDTLPDVADPKGRGRPVKERPEPVDFTDEDLAKYARDLADRFRRQRDSKGLSLRDLAVLSRVSVPTLLAIEGAKADPKAITLLRLARALGCPAGWLAFGG